MWSAGSTYIYYATAETGSSPESPPSQSAEVRGNPYKRLPPEEEPGQQPGARVKVNAWVGCFPNPFNLSASVEYTVPEKGPTRLSLHTLDGRQVARLAEGILPPGHYRAVVDGSALPSGLYVVRLQCGQHSASHKLLLVK